VSLRSESGRVEGSAGPTLRAHNRSSGALLLAYYTPNGRLVYASRVRGGINNAELERLWRLLQTLAAPAMPLNVPPPGTSRFGSSLVLGRVHWVQPELVVEVKYLIGQTTTCCAT
jgi:ATP-dependent DNA ligase